MPYTRISNTKDGKAAIRYVMNKKGNNGEEARNEIVTGINLLPDAIIPFSVQMDKVWEKASSRNVIRVHRIVQSFSRKELDPDHPEDVLIAHEIGVRTAKELYGEDCQVIVATQTDGEGHLAHNHILVSNVTLDGDGLINERTFHPRIRQVTDEITAQFIDIPEPEPAHELESPDVRGMHIYNAETAPENGSEKYIWQDDLKKRIRDAASVSKNMDEFFQQLQERGVKGIAKTATRKQPEYILYELIDTSGFESLEKVPKNLKSKSYKMGLDYQPEGVQAIIRQNQTEKGVTVMGKTEQAVGVRMALTPIDDLSAVTDPEEIARGEDRRDTAIRKIYDEFRGREATLPTTHDEIFGSVLDTDRLIAEGRERDNFLLKFQLYQNEQQMQGRQFPSIYSLDEAGNVHIDYEELNRQVQEFISKEYGTGNHVSGQGKKEAEEAIPAIPKSATGGSQKGRKKPVEKQLSREDRIKMAERVSADAEENARRKQEQEEFELEF